MWCGEVIINIHPSDDAVILIQLAIEVQAHSTCRWMVYIVVKCELAVADSACPQTDRLTESQPVTKQTQTYLGFIQDLPSPGPYPALDLDTGGGGVLF